MLRIKQAVIVEGKYDQIKLAPVLDALIVRTEGFGVFSDREKQKFIRFLAENRGIVILTDSDAAGFKIRSFLSGMVSPESCVHVYIPDLYGKEKRKDKPSKEGKLGVEGVPVEVLAQAFRNSGILFDENELPPGRKITKADFLAAGLAGTDHSAVRRREFQTGLGLPGRLSANALLNVLNSMMTRDEFMRLAVK